MMLVWKNALHGKIFWKAHTEPSRYQRHELVYWCWYCREISSSLKAIHPSTHPFFQSLILVMVAVVNSMSWAAQISSSLPDYILQFLLGDPRALPSQPCDNAPGLSWGLPPVSHLQRGTFFNSCLNNLKWLDPFYFCGLTISVTFSTDVSDPPFSPWSWTVLSDSEVLTAHVHTAHQNRCDKCKQWLSGLDCCLTARRVLGPSCFCMLCWCVIGFPLGALISIYKHGWI